jgi:membrane fusion protein, heavy metal efflux system
MKFKLNIINQSYFQVWYLAFSLFILAACGGKENSSEIKTTDPAAVSSEPRDVENTTIVSLNATQIKTVGVQFGNIEQKQLTAIIKANGHLKVPNNNKANASSLYGGVVKSILVEVGTYVKKGQVIASIANPQFIQLQEEYLTIGSKIILAEQEQKRQKELNDGNAGALRNLQSADAELKTLRTRKASLFQQIQLMGIHPNSISDNNLQAALAVTSPISGSISQVFSKIGSYVDVSSPVAEIVDNAQLHLDLNVFEKDLPLLKVGQIIHFTLTNNPTNEYDAVVFSIGSSFENETKTISVHCEVKGNKLGLIDGMNITALVSLNDITMPAVPNDAIVESEGRHFIFIVKEGQAQNNGDVVFEKVEVVNGVSNLGYTAITFINEVPLNAKVAIKGAFFINAKLTNFEEE